MNEAARVGSALVHCIWVSGVRSADAVTHLSRWRYFYQRQLDRAVSPVRSAGTRKARLRGGPQSHAGDAVRPHDIPELARDLVGTKPDVVVAVSTPVIRAVASVSSQIPIVAAFFGSDPVAEGMAVSLAKPGGHITGVAMLAEALDAKRLDILSESLPAIRKVAVLAGRPPRHDPNIKAVAAEAQKLGIELKIVEADSPAEYPGAFEKMRAAEVQGLVIVSAPDFNRDGAILAEAARVAGLPTICEWREMADSGCLMAYGPLKEELTRRAAAYVVQILRGVPPGDLPIETPTHFEFVLNQKVATELGVRFDPATLIRADEVIE